MILPKAELTPSGRPKLVPGEVERVLLDKVDIEFEESGSTEGSPPEKAYKGGYCVVTSHRLLWIDAAATPSPGRSCHMPLDSIHTVHKRVQYSLNLMNPKVRLEVQLFVDRHFKPTNRQLSATFRYLNLRCRGEAPDGFQEHLSAALSAHRLLLEQQAAKQRQQQQQQQAAAGALQQQQQQATPWSTSSGPVSHPISGALASGSFSVPPGGMWLDTGGTQQQQPWSGGGGLPPGSPLQAAPRSPVGARGLQAVDGELLSQLTDMGFPRPRVVRALLATGNEHLQAALDWILAAGEEPGLDAPLPVPEPAVVTKQELQRLQQYNMLQQQQGGQGAQGFRGGFQEQQLLNPGWGMGSVSAAAALGGGGGAGSSAAYGGGGYPNPGQPGGSWSAVGPLTAGMGPGPGPGSSGSGSGSSPHKGMAAGPSGMMAAAAPGGPGSDWAPGSTQSGPTSRMVGVAGIMTREAEKTSQTAANLAAAFQDLDNLMGMAAEMVKLAEKFRGVMGADGSITLNPSSGSSGSLASLGLTAAAAAAAGSGGGGAGPDSSGGSGSSSTSEQLLLDAETQLQLIAMGITSPVTRASAGARYHQELARQLADFLAGPLAKAGGVMMLPDVYCLFNRARGTELVSPDDLLQACDAFPQVGLPLRLRKFPSSVTVVQGNQFSDKQLCANIEQLLQRKSQAGPGTAAAVSTISSSSSSFVAGLGPALSATDVSAALLLPLTLAKEALLVAEASGVLCRDDGPEGLRFFRNFFREATPVAF